GQTSIVTTGTLTAGATGTGFTINLGASTISGNLPVANLNNGTSASSSTFWRGDGVWATTPGGGDVFSSISSTTDTRVAIFDGTTGKLIKDAPTTISSTGVLSTRAAILANTTGGSGALALLVRDVTDTNTLASISNTGAGVSKGGVITGSVTTASVRPGVIAGDTTAFEAYDTNDSVYRTFATLTAGNTPTFVLQNTNLGTVTGGVLTAASGYVTTNLVGNLPVSYLNSGTGASASTAWFGDGTWKTAGTVTSVAIAGNNGITIVSGSPITTAGTITLGLGNITPTSVTTTGAIQAGTTTNGVIKWWDAANSQTVSITAGAGTLTLQSAYSLSAVTFIGNLVGNASTATTLQTARSIYGNSFNGSADITAAVTVPFGGTGLTSATIYAPICGGTTTTGAYQSASTGMSTNNRVFTSNGSSALP